MQAWQHKHSSPVKQGSISMPGPEPHARLKALCPSRPLTCSRSLRSMSMKGLASWRQMMYRQHAATWGSEARARQGLGLRDMQAVAAQADEQVADAPS
jgi:hypothetical protein